ncbi:MAG: MBL fold metallo-hydrolase [Desulfovibrionaceae bacterium]|nr:MBL fold metallo-hydrolase [Desulfovibrionaceae bacterium]
MIIRCWGARGSIPVSGRDYFRYGGDTTCVEIRTKDDEIIVIDAGTGIRRLGNRLVSEGRFEVSVLFTHSHWDHVIGFPFFKPLYRPEARIAVHSCPLSQGSMERLLAETMRPPHFPVPFEQVQARVDYRGICLDSIAIGGVKVSSIALSHTNPGLGYRFEEDGKSFVFLTDNELSHVHSGGCGFRDYQAFARDADLLFHDAEYTGSEYEAKRGWGHSRFEDALDLARSAGVGGLGLFHHNQDRSDDQLDAMLGRCRELAPDLDCFAVGQDWERRL